MDNEIRYTYTKGCNISFATMAAPFLSSVGKEEGNCWKIISINVYYGELYIITCQKQGILFARKGEMVIIFAITGREFSTIELHRLIIVKTRAVRYLVIHGIYLKSPIKK